MIVLEPVSVSYPAICQLYTEISCQEEGSHHHNLTTLGYYLLSTSPYYI